MKIKKLTAILLASILALGILGGCSGEEEKKPAVRPEVIEGYNLAEADIAKIEKLFSDFDAAFEVLMADDSVTDDELYEYAEAVETAYEELNFPTVYSDILHDKIRSETDSAKKEAYSMLSLNVPIALDLSIEFLNYLSGDASGESCAETAVAFVNTCAEFFYGEARITDDDLDSIKFAE